MGNPVLVSLSSVFILHMMAGFFSTPAPEAALFLDGSAAREKMQVTESEAEFFFPIYDSSEPISGSVAIVTPKGRKFDFAEMRVELLGMLQVFDPEETKGFLSISREIAKATAISQDTTYPFAFPRTSKPYETYYGLSFRVRYVIRMTIIRPSNPNITRETEIWVQSLDSEPGFNPRIKTEVGFPDLIQLEFELFRQKFHLEDCIMGKVYFLSVQQPIKSMEVSILRRENVGFGDRAVKDHEIVGRFELMDGQPVRSDSIPMRLFLAQFALGPTFRNVCGLCNVRYFLNLVITDEDDRKLYKRQEIELWRSRIGRISPFPNYFS